MKYHYICDLGPTLEVSLPVRGAWVEMTLDKRRKKWYLSRSPCGERGLKLPGAPGLIW